MSFTETLQGLTGKPLADCTNQELYLALLELVRQKSADRVQPNFSSASCCPTTSSIWDCTMKPAMHWLPSARAFPISKRWSRNLLWATAVWAVWLPASSTLWQR